MAKVGRKIYYDLSNGNVILDTGDRIGAIVDTSVEQDIMDYTVLSERNRESFDVLELPFGAFSQDFAECSGYRINPQTKELEFSYPDPNAPEEPQPYRAPLSIEVEETKTRITDLELTIAEMMTF